MARYFSGALIFGISDGCLREQGVLLAEKHESLIKAKGDVDEPDMRVAVLLAVMEELESVPADLSTLLFANLPMNLKRLSNY